MGHIGTQVEPPSSLQAGASTTLLKRFYNATERRRRTRRATRAGATGWMVKAFDPAELLEVVKQVLR